MSPPTVSTCVARLVLRKALSEGADEQLLLAQSGLTRKELDDPDGVVGPAAINALWLEAAKACNQEAVGLQVFACARPGDLGLMEQLLPTYLGLEAAILGFVEHQAILQKSLGQWSTESLDNGAVALSLRFLGPPLPLHHWVAEFALASLVGTLKRAVEGSLGPITATLRQPSPARQEAYAQPWDKLPTFNAQVDGLRFEKQQLALPLKGENEALRLLLERLALTQAETPPNTAAAPLVQTVETELCRNLRESHIRDVARRLGLSERTLRRRLSEAGTSFSTLLESTKRRYAKLYLHDQNLTVQQIAFLLGFEEATSFNRAFRRWFDTTPRAFRAQLKRPSAHSSK